MEFDKADEDLDALVSAWQDGRVDDIDELVNGDMRRTAPEVYDVLISQRNAAWVETIQNLLAGSGSHFIAIGAGHVAGSNGVIERLRAAGVAVDGP